MYNNFVNSFSAEWLKKRHSLASWLVLAGGMFVPFMLTVIFLFYPVQLKNLHASGHFWPQIFQKAWQLMSFILLPMGIVLAVSLQAQLEFKNNTWKQLHATPLPFSIIYFSRLAVLLVMLLQLFILFNAGIYLSAVIPAILNRNVRFPVYPLNVYYFLKVNSNYFIICLPVLALQNLLSLQFRNYLLPVGVGLSLVVAGLIGLSWKYIYMIPSAYTAVYYLQATGHGKTLHNLQEWSLCYFALFVLLGYWLYIAKKEKD